MVPIHVLSWRMFHIHLEECLLCCCWVEYFLYVFRLNWVTLLFKSYAFFLIFCWLFYQLLKRIKISKYYFGNFNLFYYLFCVCLTTSLTLHLFHYCPPLFIDKNIISKKKCNGMSESLLLYNEFCCSKICLLKLKYQGLYLEIES